MNFPKKLQQKLLTRMEDNSFRTLPSKNSLVDFSSNDYLGFAKKEALFKATHHYLEEQSMCFNGATGSRLLTGNHLLYSTTETYIAAFHQAEAALLFNSGYTANLGFFSCVPQRNDIILYDELCHASIRDGIQMSLAKSFRFLHNDYEQLEKLLEKLTTNKQEQTTIYIVTESVFSMDGDTPNLETLVAIGEKHNALLVIDEAHALGVFGHCGEGVVQQQHLEHHFFARIITFGKALGCHGAAILGSKLLKDYLVNFSRSFIYTTGLSPHAVATIYQSYLYLKNHGEEVEQLTQVISYFNRQKKIMSLDKLFVYSKSAIQCAIIPGNIRVKRISKNLEEKGFDVKPILYPTVPLGQERLRFCLHNYTRFEEIDTVLAILISSLYER